MIGYFINKYNLKKYNGNWLNFSSSLVRSPYPQCIKYILTKLFKQNVVVLIYIYYISITVLYKIIIRGTPLFGI